MVKHEMMDKYDARNDADFADSDKLNSPGRKLDDAADPATKAKVDANADAFDAKNMAASGPCPK